MSTKVFNWLTPLGGGTVYGHELTANGSSIEPGLLVILDSGGRTVSLAAASGSAPLGFAYGDRDLVYAPTSKVYANGEALNALTGHGFVEVSAEFFSTGSLPGEVTGQTGVYAGANGKLAMTGTLKVGRLIDTKSFTNATGGTGEAVNVSLIEFDFGV